MSLRSFKSKYAIAVFALLMSTELMAGFLFAPQVAYNSFSFRPLEEEDTGNYYGYGLGLQMGYSAIQKIDMAGFFEYIPGNLDAPDPLDSNAEMLLYGGTLGFRIARSVYIGFLGGISQYNLPTRAKDIEVGGQWTGSAYGLRIGGLIPTSDTTAFQLTVGAMQCNLDPVDGGEGRIVDLLSLSLAFVYNTEDTLGFVDAIFSNSIETLFR